MPLQGGLWALNDLATRLSRLKVPLYPAPLPGVGVSEEKDEEKEDDGHDTKRGADHRVVVVRVRDAKDHAVVDVAALPHVQVDAVAREEEARSPVQQKRTDHQT